MRSSVISSLVEELKCHSGMIPFNEDYVVSFLAFFMDPGAGKFSIKLPIQERYNNHIHTEHDRSHFFSLRCLLKNQSIQTKERSLLDCLTSAVVYATGMHSSDVLVEDLCTNNDLVSLMNQCRHPYSLLGKLKTYDENSSQGSLFIITRPILTIPEIHENKDLQTISAWEQQHTRYEKESGLFRRNKQITAQEYFMST